MNNQVRKPRTTSESGVFPKPDLASHAAKELPDKSKQPVNDDASITGAFASIKLKAEGEDDAKGRDDSASGSRPAKV